MINVYFTPTLQFWFIATREFNTPKLEACSTTINTILRLNHLLIYRLDQILGKPGSKTKDAYASKICLASRVVKVERQVSFKLLIQWSSVITRLRI